MKAAINGQPFLERTNRMSNVELAARWLSLQMEHEASKDVRERHYIRKQMRSIDKCLRNRGALLERTNRSREDGVEER